MPAIGRILLSFLLLSFSPLFGSDEESNNKEYPSRASGKLSTAEIATVGMDVLTRSPIVLLRELDSGRTVPIWIGFSEAQAIARVLHGIGTPRPLTHDLTASLLKEGGLTLEEVVVHDLRAGTYIGAIRMKKDGGDGQVIEVDSRPSDALALALRTGAAIRISEKVLGQSPDYHFAPPGEADQVVQVLGLTVVAATEEQREEYGLGDRRGAFVTDATGQAARQGLERGDLITRANDTPVYGPMDLLGVIMDEEAGREIDLQFYRGGEERNTKLRTEASREPAVEI